jgi:hypothetical protein
MMEVEKVSEVLGFCPELTRLVAREDFIKKEKGANTQFWCIPPENKSPGINTIRMA